MQRFYVCRAYLKWKGKLYRKGDLLPVEFTHHDKARSIYNSRIAVCEVPDEVDNTDSVDNGNGEVQDTSAKTPVATPPESTPPVTSSEKGDEGADKAKPKFNFGLPLTGTPSK